jgi:NAD(P)-dependent dehydrogenase (short-subunit alcohol dehydrogenase family)
MDLQLKGKRALVTGSSSGIGQATARVLAAEGVTVVVHGRDPEKAHNVTEQIGKAGGQALMVVGDLSTDAGAKKVAAYVLSELGSIDILINNAGVPEFTGWMDTTADQWAAIYNNNVISMVRMIRLFLPKMKEQRWGRIIQIGSVVAWQPFAAKPHYCAARAAVLNLTVSLSRELAETGVTANTVSPGVILTPPAQRYFVEMARQHGWEEDWKVIERKILEHRLYNPTGRLGTPEDVAHVIAFLASPRAGYINGSNYRIDGGATGNMN